MTLCRAFALGVTVGAFAFPLGYHLAFRISDRHFLSIDN